VLESEEFFGQVASPSKEPPFKQFVEEQRRAPTPQEHAEIDQRAAPSAIIAEDAIEATAPGQSQAQYLLQSTIRYLDYQRAQLTVRVPEGDSGDILWLVNKTLSNAGVSPEKALVTSVQVLGQYLVDLYAQNAKIRKRLTELEARAQTAEQDTDELIGCVTQLELFMWQTTGHTPNTLLMVSPAMRERLEKKMAELQEQRRVEDQEQADLSRGTREEPS
jgi:hypothetical protein